MVNHVKWKIVKLHKFNTVRYQNGLAHLGFHDTFGNQYALSYDEHWIACLGATGGIKWSAGERSVENSKQHINCQLSNPTFVTDQGDGSVLVTSSGDKRVYRIHPQEQQAEMFIDGEKLGMKDMGNCEYDGQGNIWINEITGCKIWQFDANRQLMNTLGTGMPGFQCEETAFDGVQFSWVYDLRRGSDGNIYVLDSRNYAVRMIDIHSESVKCVAGTGEAGYTGDGGKALLATFGSDSSANFDGPWSLAIDEDGNLYVGDTQNHVVRMVVKDTHTISTIAGKHQLDVERQNNPEETDPRKINLPLICSLDYHDGKLYVPDWDGNLLVMEKV
jgi:hypothetical protein